MSHSSWDHTESEATERAHTDEKCRAYREVFWFCFCNFSFVWTIFKVSIEFVTILLWFSVWVFRLCSMWDLSSLIRN